MKVLFEEVRLSTRSRADLIDITGYVEDHVRKSGIKDGLCLVYSPHSTTAIVVNERESGLMRDILRKAEQEFPVGAGWLHDRVDDNAHAHLGSSFVGSSRIFPVRNGRVFRGTWQEIFLLELDGPRNRGVLIEVLGE